jgi:hypothetical protein
MLPQSFFPTAARADSLRYYSSSELNGRSNELCHYHLAGGRSDFHPFLYVEKLISTIFVNLIIDCTFEAMVVWRFCILEVIYFTTFLGLSVIKKDYYFLSG